MGSVESRIAGVDGYRLGLGDLPESCVASVLVHLDPPQICSVARLNRAFRGAAAADLVWEPKLPLNYHYLLEKAESEDGGGGNGSKGLTKKEIYARLCRPNVFDGGTKVFWLEKCRGRIYMSIASKALHITGIDDRRYWSHITTEESRFHTVAYLQQTWWLEVDGEIEFSFPAGGYSLFFRLHLGRAYRKLGCRICKSEHIHGWDIKPVRFQLSTSDGQHAQTKHYLREPGSWIHYHVGDFVVKNSAVVTKLKFSMIQIDCTHTKGGLCVDSVIICPSGCKPAKGS